ncbi:MAG: cytosine permease [Streptosporangiaceae bacterium]|nr:cytosine permease [Streptosporangiaceae bacterium]MBV9854593.1 cytosine permease [Streptosporangiaceae bacterium]
MSTAQQQGPLGVELNGINVISESERKGRPRSLFWPWFAANISVLGVSYGSFVLGFGISFWQATIAGLIGIVVSFLLVGFIAVAGKRGSAPTLVLSRAAFGVRGNELPSVVSWMLNVGWEIVLTVLATLATATVFHRLGWSAGDVTKVVAFLVIAALIVGSAVLGFDTIMRLQTVITVVTGVLTVIYFILVADKIHWSTVSAIHPGSAQAFIGAIVFVMTGFGLGWVNTGADYSRYLPRRSSSGGVIWWTTFGSSVAPVFLLGFGLLLAGSSTSLSSSIASDPIGALSTILPTWYLIPFVFVAVLGLVGGAVLDIYSSGLTLLAAGLRAPRWAAALVDGVLMILGTIYVVFFSKNFIGPFQGFLITLGVPISAWCGVMLADILMRRADYAEADLYSPAGRYGSVRWVPVALMVLGSVIGFGLVVNTSASWLKWQGYLLGPFGLGGKAGTWASANLGVIVALVIAFAGWLGMLARGARSAGPGGVPPGTPRPLRSSPYHHAAGEAARASRGPRDRGK